MIKDVNKNEYLKALKEYGEERSLNKLVDLFEKEQQFYLEKYKYLCSVLMKVKFYEVVYNDICRRSKGFIFCSRGLLFGALY